MTILAFIISAATVILLHKELVSKNPSQTKRICITGVNILFSIFFVAFIAVISMVRSEADAYIDQHIKNLEQETGKIYPGALDEQMSTVKVKEMLIAAFEKDQNHSVNAVAGNIAKTFMENYTLAVLKAIQSLERTSDRISIKHALVSVKETSLSEAMPYFSILEISLLFAYFVYVIISVAFTRMLNSPKGGNIPFGNNAEKNPSGTTTKE